MNDSVGQISSIPVSVVDIEPMNFRQVFEEKQQLMSVRSISSIFQQTRGIRNGNFTRPCRQRHEEVVDVVVRDNLKISIWVKDQAFNGLLTLVDNQRGQIEVSAASRIKEEVTDPNWNIVPQEIFVSLR